MDVLAVLQSGHGVALALVVFGLVGASGLALGSLKVGGVGLGIGGTLFTGIAFAHFGVVVDPVIVDFTRDFGLVLFVYAIGLHVGPGFFSALKRDGLAFNGMAVAVVLLGVATTWALYRFAGVPLPAVLGLMAGATTNTPSLAAAQQMLGELGVKGPEAAQTGLGYAVAYPFGILGILTTMLLLRFALRLDPAHEMYAFDEARGRNVCPIDTANIEITNPNLVGLTLRQIPGLGQKGVVVSRLLHDGTVEVAHPEHTVALGDVVLAVGPRERLVDLRLILGAEAQVNLKTMASPVRWERLVVTRSKVLGRTIHDLDFRHTHGVTISRLTRAGVELVPSAEVSLQFGDILTVIGEADAILAVAAIVGNTPTMLQHAQVAPVFIGIALGVLLGSMPVMVPGMPAALKLGLAGGPLLAAIALARLGHVGPLVWFMPPAANELLREIGIVLFLACVGLKAGGSFVTTLVHGDGVLWMGLAALITLLPLLVVGFVGRLVLKTNYLSLCGLLAGSMTDPPALAFANAISPSPAPSLAYATVYPVVMVLRVLAPQILVLLLM